MKKIYPFIVCLSLLLVTTCPNAQPKLVGVLGYNGPQNGGSIFRNDLPSTTPNIIRSFNNLAPHRPMAGMCAGNDDWLYGFLSYNGTDDMGGLYRIRKDGTGFTMLYNIGGNSQTIPFYHTDGLIYFTDVYEIKTFNPANNAVASVGTGGVSKTLLIDANDWIFYTTNFAISKIKTDGTGSVELHAFNAATEGSNGFAGLTESPGDTVWGVNGYGGLNDKGTLYSMKKDGSGFHVHHQFDGPTGTYPESKPVYFDGKIYGTTQQGGTYNFGVLYVMNADGTDFHVIHHFDGGTYNTGYVLGNISISSNGRIFGAFGQHYYQAGYPFRFYKLDTSGANFEVMGSAITYNQHDFGHFHMDPLLADNDEQLYVATQEMGRHDGGVISKFDTSGNGISLHQLGYSPTGFRPVGGVIKGTNGKLFGITVIGGPDGNGVIYSVNTDGTGYIKMHEFSDAEGYGLSGKLLEATDGKLYGTAAWGGPTNTGLIYRIDKTGANFEVVYTFPNFSDGYYPNGSLIEDGSGMLYGTAQLSSGNGAVFKINKNGTGYTMLKKFDEVNGLTYPMAGLTQFGNYLYGVCAYGGPTNKGGIFRVRKDGTGYEELNVFTGAPSAESPRSVLFLASNAKLYSTTDFGGPTNEGTLFRIDTNGANFTILKEFSSTVTGGYPSGGVIQASDLLIYGSASYGGTGSSYSGTIFRMNLDGTGFTILHAFDNGTEGANVSALLDLNGNFALPVELLSFNAEKRTQTVLLTWKTAQEQNSDRFIIERSHDSRNFIAIGSVVAAGNSTSGKNYSFTDDGPLTGVNYYRLKQTDRDGSYDYSKVVSVSFDKIDKLALFPNPAADRLHVRLPQAGKYASLRVLDASGKIVMHKNIVSSTTIDLDVNDLPRGWYLLQITGDDKLEKAFIKE